MNLNIILVEAQKSLDDGKLDDAKKKFIKALKKAPTNINILNVLASIELRLGNRTKALDLLRRSSLLKPNQFEITLNMAICQIELGDFDGSLETINKAIALYPSNPKLYFNKARAYSGLNNFDFAKKNYLKAIELDNAYEDAYLNIGFLLNLNNFFDEAIKYYQKLLSINSENSNGYYNLAIAYENKKFFKEASDNYKKTISLNPSNYSALFNLSCIHLQQGNFSEGWNMFESRWHKTEKINLFDSLDECSIFDENKKIIIWGEQGIGDQILFSSILKDIEHLKNITLLIEDKLKSLFKRSFKNFSIIGFNESININNFDCQIPLGSIGKILRKKKETFKNQKTFLVPDFSQTKNLKENLSEKNKILCGISWRSNNRNIGSAKSISLDNFLPIFKKNNLSFIDLQYGDNEKEKLDIKKRFDIEIKSISSIDKFNNIDGLASLIDACDIVITISNVTAHLAGSIGKKVFLLAPYSLGSLFYWFEDGKNIWYPSIHVIRQTVPNDWKGVINELSKKLINI